MRIFAIALILTICAGCSILPKNDSPPVTYFDIGFPQTSSVAGFNVSVRPFESGGSDMEQMIFRDSSCTLKMDEFNRWRESPSKLLQCYFQLALNGNAQTGKAEQISLHFSVLRFDSDLTDKTSNLIADVKLFDGNGKSVLWQAIVSEKIKAESNTASSYAKGMEKAASNVAARIRKQILELKK